ncbi:antitoxin YezG family protein [Tumebacillus sp. ITR2]|uniref:Antitoxin YezG family protein n=1 Tax=Tumebacillus amylolyticus TaxID=2801339 RepID=A0ABS1JFX3_9BACL|nr:antitoxin YezG family protein [Tumebacillus amylolyticus]MBL0389183.1 antitoxin YezG family protein [Tumebacillus amylolyticus]
METKRMGDLYQTIAEKLNEIVPGEWCKIVLCAEIIPNDSSEVYFYFDTPQNPEFVYSHYIPQIYGVSNRIYKDLLIEMHKLFEELQREFQQHNNDVWYGLTLVLESTGKFKIEYDYDNPLISELNSSQRQYVWQYKNLGILPKSKANRKFLEEYLKNHDETQK